LKTTATFTEFIIIVLRTSKNNLENKKGNMGWDQSEEVMVEKRRNKKK